MKLVEPSLLGSRLLEDFGAPVPKDKIRSKIAEVLDVRLFAVTNHLQDRIPDTEKLQPVSAFTNCSIHWLITGEGEKFLNAEKKVNIDDTFRDIVREIVCQEITLVEKNRGETRGEDVKKEKEKVLNPTPSQK